MSGRTKTARRRIGDALVEIEFTGRVVGGRWAYRGCVTAPSAIMTITERGAERRAVVWTFDGLLTGVGGVADGRGGKHAPESDEALDDMAGAAVSHGSALTSDEPDTTEAMERVAAIEAATGLALRDDGTYEVSRGVEEVGS